MKEMKKNKIFLTMIFLTLFGILNCMNVKADGNFLLISDKDSYVNVDDPLTNYGLSQSLRLDTNYEIYLHFTFPQEYFDYRWEKINMTLYSHAYTSGTINISICTTSNVWEEDTIVWDNKPSHGTLLASYQEKADWEIEDYTLNVYLDLLNFITNNGRLKQDELSLCIYSEFSENIMYVTYNSKDSLAWGTYNGARIELTGTHDPSGENTPNIYSYDLFLFVLIAILSSIFIILRKKK